MNAAIAQLALRRIAPLWLALSVAAILVATALFSRAETSESAALARQGVWSLTAILASPLLAFRSASAAAKLSRAEYDFAGATPMSRVGWFFSCWSGALAASLGALLLAAPCGELAARFDVPTAREVGLASTPEHGVLDGREPLRWSVDARAGETLRLPLTFLAIEPTAELRWEAVRGEQRSQTLCTLSRPMALELAAPAGEGLVELTLARTAGGAIALLTGERMQRLVPAGSARESAFVLGAHAFLAWAAFTALALGLATWIGPGLAATLALALQLAGWLVGDAFATDATTLGALLRALEVAGHGIVPAWPPLGAWMHAALCVSLGSLAFVRGFGRRCGGLR
jgi:hypothetical protein